jgi:Ser/Thr protein kinase RdoA (MazF antagonist)
MMIKMLHLQQFAERLRCRVRREYFMDTTQILKDVVRYFDLGSYQKSAKNPKGLVNVTHVVETSKGLFVLQKLSGIFDERVVEDHLEVARFLRFKGFSTPRLIETKAGSRSLRYKGALWKASEYIAHDESTRSNKDAIASAAAMLGHFHCVMEECTYTPKYSIPNFHATDAIICKMKRVFEDFQKVTDVAPYREIFEYIVGNIPLHYLPANMRRTLIHGDPKFDNFLFKENHAIALIDFDTIMIGSRLLDVGDGLRSWCRYDGFKFNKDVFEAALAGYNKAATLEVTWEEAWNATALITLELAARFLIDCFEESYFEWNSEKYQTRTEHNLARVREMVAYHGEICRA